MKLISESKTLRHINLKKSYSSTSAREKSRVKTIFNRLRATLALNFGGGVGGGGGVSGVSSISVIVIVTIAQVQMSNFYMCRVN